MIVSNNADFAHRAKHITTTSKIPHPYEFVHDEVSFNYRMPNLNAALGCAQMERLNEMISIKRNIAHYYQKYFGSEDVHFVSEREGTLSNYWLNAIIMNSKKDRDFFIHFTNDNGVMTRPIWRLMTNLEMFSDCQKDNLENSRWLEERVVNIPSSVPNHCMMEII